MKTLSPAMAIIASALIWGVTMIACVWVVRDTPYKEEISSIMTTGVIMHMFLVWIPTNIKKKEKSEE